MSSRGRAFRAASVVTATAYIALAAAPLLALAVVCILGARPAQALPSYARQTGQECAACHNGFPELTPYGRDFKLNGYVWSGGASSVPPYAENIPPISAIALPSFTNVRKGVDGGLVPGFGYNNDFAFAGGLYYAGKIFDGLGAFAQVGYNNVSDRIFWDNIDIRYAKPSELLDRGAVFGVSANNNPTVNDVWNSTPAWGYPYVTSPLAPSPGAMTLIDGVFSQQVVGLNPYIYWNRLVYAEVGGYRTLSPRGLTTLGIEPEGTSAFQGIAPSWRFAIEPQWGYNSWEFGTFGLATNLIPDRITGSGTDHLTDVGVDTQYQFLGARDSFSVQARFITENQNLGASQALGLSSNSHNNLRTSRVKGTYWYQQAIGLTAAYFKVNGSGDPLLYGPISAVNSPNSSGWSLELNYIPFNYGGPDFWPWLNVKFGLQYVHYNKFNGATANYNGAGRNAGDNNTLLAYAFFAFWTRGGRRYGVKRRMLDNEARRLAASTPAAFVFVALAVAACGGTGPESGSGDSTVADTLHVCDSCHGRDGRSISPTFPDLAGQQKDYIVAQLQAYRDKTRADPAAKTYMWGMAARLSDPTIQAIAAYYASQTPVAGEPGASPEMATGKKIYAEGIPSESVLPCIACHGEKGEGNGPIPRLAGQHQDYLALQLEEYASMTRANEIMHQTSKDMTAEQISEVTAYIRSL